MTRQERPVAPLLVLGGVVLVVLLFVGAALLLVRGLRVVSVLAFRSGRGLYRVAARRWSW